MTAPAPVPGSGAGPGSGPRGRPDGDRPIGIAAWFLYDFADSAYSTVIGTFLFSVYFARSIVGDEISGTTYWTWTMAASGLLVALVSPIFGAIADRAGPRKPWLAVWLTLCVVPTSLLWFAEPDRAFLAYTIALLILSSAAHGLSHVFYNAMLTDVAPADKLGRISGWAWGMGYLGGLGCLALCLTTLVLPAEPWFGFSTDNAENIRATTLIVAAWFFLFALPMFLLTRDVPPSGLGVGQAVRSGLTQLKVTLQKLTSFKDVLVFLIASAVYRDGLTTLFTVGGLFAAGTFGMDFEEILIFAITLNVAAGIGAALFAALDDGIGSKRTVLISLMGLLTFGTAVLLVEEKTAFMTLALGIGLFVGPVQAASRSLLARLTPQPLMTEFFGLYALTGKAIAFVGPFLFGLVTELFQSQRAGMAVILVMWLLGAALLCFVKEPPRRGAVPAR
ncbi:MAG: MFS transporter [Geminicoccaceae bacterium]|nr:MAG: MFS transporter [Geminicoccaceae bacterium]